MSLRDRDSDPSASPVTGAGSGGRPRPWPAGRLRFSSVAGMPEGAIGNQHTLRLTARGPGHGGGYPALFPQTWWDPGPDRSGVNLKTVYCDVT